MGNSKTVKSIGGYSLLIDMSLAVTDGHNQAPSLLIGHFWGSPQSLSESCATSYRNVFMI